VEFKQSQIPCGWCFPVGYQGGQGGEKAELDRSLSAATKAADAREWHSLSESEVVFSGAA